MARKLELIKDVKSSGDIDYYLKYGGQYVDGSITTDINKIKEHFKNFVPPKEIGIKVLETRNV